MRRAGGVWPDPLRGSGRPCGSSAADILLEFERGRSLLNPGGPRVDLSQALGREVDVATRASLHPRLRDRILRELVPRA